MNIQMPQFSRFSRSRIVSTSGAIALVTAAYLSVFKVDATQNAIVTTNGDISRVAGPGLGFKLPIFQSVNYYPVDLQTLQITQTRGVCGTQASGQYTADGSTYTKDQQFVYASVTAQYSLPSGEDLKTIHRKYQNYETVLTSYLSQAMKEVLGGYNTTEIPGYRLRIANEIGGAFQNQIDREKLPLAGRVNVQFKNFDFSCQYEAQVENAAEAKTQLTRNETELAIQRVQKDKTIVAAEAEKQQATLQGEGEAAKILAKATAEAKGITLMQTALANSRYVVDYVRAQRWDGKLPVNIYGSAPLPFLDVTKQQVTPPQPN